MERPVTAAPEAYALASYLVGPFAHDASNGDCHNTHESFQAWQVPYYETALSALRTVVGQERVPADWVPSPAEGAELFRELAYERKLHGMVKGLHDYIDDYKTGRTTTRLRDDQQEALDDMAADVVRTGTDRQITVKSATGTGKTAIIINLIQGLKYREQPSDPVRAVVLVPSKDILAQTISSFKDFAPEIDLGVYFGEKKVIRNVTVMTYRSFDMAVRSGKLTREMVDVIVNDEEHESGGASISQSLRRFCEDPVTKKRKLMFGLSATTRETENLAHVKTIVESIDRGILSPISIKHCKTDATIHEVKQGRHRTREEYTDEELAALIDNDPRNELIIREVVRGLASGRRVAVRCLPGGKLLHPTLLNERLRKITTTIEDPYTRATSSRPIRSVVIDGEMSMSKRRLIYNAFNNPLLDGRDGVDVLLFVDTLVRGWDSPIAKKLINGCPSLSWTVMEQLLGRITRPFKRMDGTIVYGQAVDLVDESKSGQVFFDDVINRYAPKGKRYIRGRIIGPGLRDSRREAGSDGVFEDIPELELEDFNDKQATWRPVSKPLYRQGATGRVEPAQPKGGENEASSTSKTTQNTKSPTPANGPSVQVVENIKQNPFDAAQELPSELAAGSISLEKLAAELGVDVADIEDIILDKRVSVYRTNGKTGTSNYMVTGVTRRRMKSWIEDL